MAKKSPAPALKRRVALRTLYTLFALQAGDADALTIMEKVREALGDQAYGSQPLYAFRRDLQCLRDSGLAIHYLRHSQRYHLQEVPFPLRLSEEEVTALAWLRDYGRQDIGLGWPLGQGLLSLGAKILRGLPLREQRLVERGCPLKMEPLLSEDLSSQRETIAVLERALTRRQRLQFVYGRRNSDDQAPQVVEPYALELHDGYLYLKAYHLESEQVQTYRVSQIRPGSARMLPTVIPPVERPSRRLTLRYRLSPYVAHEQVNRHFPDHQVESLPDGSALVTVKMDSLSWACRCLLPYGEHVEVLEPEAVRQEMARIGEAITKVHGNGGVGGEQARGQSKRWEEAGERWW